ncbi:hypothetical protein Lal_00042355 [Lupinus albus]|nr:hypothetical protein Lal_00042355 [Lupinus albus]
MASSSKRPRSSKSKQGESTSKSNPLNLTRLLANDAQRKVFEENFHGRAIFTTKYDRKKFYLSICRISKVEIERRKQQSLGETVKNRDILSAGYLMLEDRLIHYFLSYVILPKFSNHSQISDIQLQLISQSLLPYAIFITKILEHFGVSLDGETKVALNLRKIKHRTDRQPAHTDEPEPTAEPNQLEYHAQSSSSAVMPTNQMIMDELVSLRGYITARMGAFDTH